MKAAPAFAGGIRAKARSPRLVLSLDRGMGSEGFRLCDAVGCLDPSDLRLEEAEALAGWLAPLPEDLRAVVLAAIRDGVDLADTDDLRLDQAIALLRDAHGSRLIDSAESDDRSPSFAR